MPGDAFLPALARQRNVYFAGPADGIIANGSTTCGAALQALVDLVDGSTGPVSTLKGATIVLPAGDIMLEQAVALKSKVRLVGQGAQITKFWPTTHAASALFTMASGYNSNNAFVGFSLFGGTIGGDPRGPARNAGQRPMSFIAAGTPSGLSNATFEDVEISGFDTPILFQGGTDFLKPIQTIRFNFCRFTSPGTQPVFEARGQMDSCMFTLCEFFMNDLAANASTASGVAVKLGNQADTPCFANLVKFDTCKWVGGFQVADIVQSTSINFHSCWFENLRRGIVYNDSFSSGSVRDCNFKNVARSGDSGEYLLSVGQNGRVHFQGNRAQVNAGNITKGITGHASAIVSNDKNLYDQGVTTEIETVSTTWDIDF